MLSLNLAKHYFITQDQVILDQYKAEKPGKRVKRGEWDRVAALVGPNVTPDQCKMRWINYLRHKAQGLRIGVDFTTEEVKCAVLLVLYCCVSIVLYCCTCCVEL